MRIDFYNRDGNEVWLEEVGDQGWWQLRLSQPCLFELYEDEGEGIYAVDPPGGPFIHVGEVIGPNDTLIITKIKNTSLGIFLLLKENFMIN